MSSEKESWIKRVLIPYLDNEYEVYQLMTDLNELSAKDRLTILNNFLEYVEPKKSRQEVKTEDANVTIKIVRE